jgi:hypothetical protein
VRGVRGVQGRLRWNFALPTPPVGAEKQPQGPIGKSMRLFKLHSNGLEPLTFGSVDRCSIQLSYECPDVGTKECTRFFRNGKQVPDLIASCLF